MRNWGVGMIAAGWLLVAGLAWMVMDGWLQTQENPNAGLAQMSMGDAVVLKRNAAGHYVAPGRLNGVAVTFLVDTGATNIAMPMQVARAVGAEPGATLRTSTAAGDTIAYATRLRSVELGGLSARDVSGTIVPDMEGRTVLLGMNFLSRFAITIESDEMYIHAR